jgi:Protein of unknown function (DUF2808)
MKFYTSALVTLLTIAAIGGSQSIGHAQSSFQVPTHPRLSELKDSSVKDSSAMPMMPSMKTQGSQLQLRNGQNFFSHPPTLIRTNALNNISNVPGTYEFTIVVPADAGVPLKAITIVQDENLETVQFDVSQSKAFAGDHYAAGPELRLTSVGGAQETPGTAMIVFDQPVQPGSTVTVAVDAVANPQRGSVYEFGVTAYPTGDTSRGQFLGYGRIHFYGAE